MVIEILIADDLLTKSPDLVKLLKEYDELIQRKRVERSKKSIKSTKRG